MRPETICKVCQQPVFGEYIQALGSTWHPDHFLCAACSQPIRERQFVEYQGQAYHLPCYRLAFAPRCAICGTLIDDEAYQDEFGNIFCIRHNKEYNTCESCGRLICPQLTGGGLRYSDGRQVCHQCRKTAITEHEQAADIFQEINKLLRVNGLDFGGLHLNVVLLDANSLGRYHADHVGEGRLLGVTLQEINTSSDGTRHHEVSGIGILWGLPREMFEEVAAHELGHAWLAVKQIDGLSSWRQEGFCNLLAFLWLSVQDTAAAKRRIRHLEDNPDAIYGEGYRRVKKILERYSFRELINHVEQFRTLPV